MPGQAAPRSTVVNRTQRAWRVLEAISDPEIPVVSIRELGILREINDMKGELEVVITPTYSGCPAMGQIEDDVRAALAANDFGIAPPHTVPPANVVRFARPAASPPVEVPCPRCGSCDTTETSHFSSTACKALYKCLHCLEPFDYFKPY
jgi:ring-1,2-phenylacetyl-CoA epoxidase subunit PaaD